MVNKRKSGGKSKSREGEPLPLFSIDGSPESVPAAGYRNGTSLNNAGSNGNYWSSTANEDNSNNAYNLNFNSGNNNWNNNNNRNNGQSVRPVAELASPPEGAARPYRLSAEQLLLDLYKAYKDARRHKRWRESQMAFEMRLEENLVALRDELLARTYKPRPSICFIVHDPKMREVFAADFRDRIVHHLFYNYTHTLFERTFIADSYSCIKGRGTHYGIRRLERHIRSESLNYQRPCYALQIDIKGYFMHIDRLRLLALCRETMRKMRHRSSDKEGMTWRERIDYGFADYLLETIVLHDPTEGCHVLGDRLEWERLPSDKSLFLSAPNCGLPIGNLTSQLFSNVYLNAFDQYAKRTLGCRHYGRYVDDAFVVSSDRRHLRSLIKPMRRFLAESLGLSVNPDKLKIVDVRHGVLFLGAFLKPYRSYVSSATLRRMRRKLNALDKSDARCASASVSSFLGVLSYHRSYCLRRVVFSRHIGLLPLHRRHKDRMVVAESCC